MPRYVNMSVLVFLGAAILSVGVAMAQGSRLIVTLDATPPHLDVMTNTTREVTEPSHHVFETLFSYDVGFRPQPMLVDTWSVADDGRSWTFTLRRGIPFHDGSIMSVDDVEASFNRWIRVSNMGRSYAQAFFEKVDDLSFRIVNPTPRADLLENLSDSSQSLVVLPAAIANAAGTDPITDPSQWIGTGPFVFVGLIPDQSILVRKFDGYVPRDEEPSGHGGGKIALVDEVEWRIIKDVPTRTAALRSGEVDILPDGIPGADKPILEADRDIVVQVIPGWFKWGPIFNGKSALTGNVLIRQAISAAMDNEELALAMVGDSDLFDINPGLSFRGSFFYSDAGADGWNQNDPERARALLAQAGYAGEEIVIISTKAVVLQDRMATVLQAQLQDAGMRVRIDWYDAATLRQIRTQPSDWDILPAGYQTTFNPLIYGQTYRCDSGSWAGFCEAELDVYFARASATVDLDERKVVFEELQAAMHEEFVPWVPIGDFMALRAFRSDLSGVRPFKDFRAWGISK